MTNTKKSNKGFTLIELIIAIAMLAFLMTAVSVFMTSGIISFKGAKADIRVHNSAQEVYDKISDAVMEAKDVYIFGYVQGDDKLYCFMRHDYDELNAKGEPDAAAQALVDKNKITRIKDMVGTSFFNGLDVELAYFDSFSADNIQVKALVIDTSVPIDESDFNDATSVKAGANAGEYMNQLTNKSVPIVAQTRKDASDNDVPILDKDGKPLYTVNDTIRQMFIFEGEKLYYMTKYAFATANDDNLVDAGGTGKKDDFLFSSSFDTTADGRTDVYARLDVTNSAVSIDLNFSDKNMTYKTNGMIKIRNSFVLRAKK